MILNLVELKLKQYSGLLSANVSKENDWCLLSVKDRALYFSSEKILVKINVDLLEVIEEDESRILTIPRTELLHIMSYSNSLTIKKNNKYHTDSNISGVFNINDSALYSYSSFSQIFTELDNYEEYFTINNEDEFKRIIVASNFTFSKDRNPVSWFMFIENDTIFSSSLYRIYTNKYDVNAGVQINLLQSLLPIISCYPFPIVIKKMNKSIAIINDKVQMICSNIEKVETNKLISDERFISMKNELLNNSSVINFKAKDLIDKLEYLKWYAKENKNFKTLISITEKNTALISVKENVGTIDIDGIKVTDGVSFNFNLESLLGALKGRYNNDEVVTLYINETIQIFCFKLGDEEYYYSSKIVE